MHFHIITLFPKAFDSYLGESIIARAIEKKKIKVSFYNPRDFTPDKWKRVDQRPYGGGPGMVLEAPSILKAADKAAKKSKKGKKPKYIFLAPGGTQFTNDYAAKLAKKYSDVVLISGRYEGIDARVKKALRAEAVSVGPYVTTGGELPAMIIMDAVSRRVPGVLGKIASLEENRVSSHETYTRPDVITWKDKKYKVPTVLKTGNHAKIDAWKNATKKIIKGTP